MRRGYGAGVWETRFALFALLVIVIGVQMSCSHWRDRYFDDGVGEITQEDVRKKLGKPHIVKDPFLSEETTWIYRYGVSESELNPIGVKTIGESVNALGETAASLIGKGSGENKSKRDRVVCIRYVLIFDEGNVLRNWKREPCRTRRQKKLFETRS